jgi:nucleoside-diphosphate-sugar epimerase
VESANPDFVIHLGALTPVRLSYENPFPFLRVNFQGTCNIVHAIVEAAPRARLIYASTAEVYGWQGNNPIQETAMLRPASPYGVSKSAADEYVQMAGKVFALKYTILRCNNTYGRKGERGFLVEYVIASILKGGPVYIGAPNHVRDYMFVDDHVAAYLLCLEDEAEGEVFNVSPGNPTTNLELAKEIAHCLSYSGQIIEGSYPPGYPYRPARWDTQYIVLDSSRIRNKLGWTPSVTLREGLKITIDAWLEAQSATT